MAQEEVEAPVQVQHWGKYGALAACRVGNGRLYGNYPVRNGHNVGYGGVHDEHDENGADWVKYGSVQGVALSCARVGRVHWVSSDILGFLQTF